MYLHYGTKGIHDIFIFINRNSKKNCFEIRLQIYFAEYK